MQVARGDRSPVPNSIQCFWFSGFEINRADSGQTGQAVREVATTCPCPAPCKLTFDLMTLKVVSESRVMWATSLPILVFLGLSVLDLGPMYATDRRQTRIVA